MVGGIGTAPTLTRRGLFTTHSDGQQWYRTGDLVEEDEAGNYTFRGRRDRMVKRFGYRIELGEIENALVAHDSMLEAALVAYPDESQGVKIRAYVTTKPGPRISLVAFKRHCAQHIPRYAIPDRFQVLDAIEDLDRQGLPGSGGTSALFSLNNSHKELRRASWPSVAPS